MPYYTQDLQTAMKKETQLFTRHLIDKNESIVRFIDADAESEVAVSCFGVSGRREFSRNLNSLL